MSVIAFPGKGRTHKVGRANVGTGEYAHAWADELAGLVRGMEVRFHPTMSFASQRLMATLGVRVVFDDRVAPPRVRAHPERVATPGGPS